MRTHISCVLQEIKNLNNKHEEKMQQLEKTNQGNNAKVILFYCSDKDLINMGRS